MIRTIFFCVLLVGITPSCNKDRRTEFFKLNYFVDFEILPGLNTFDTHFYVISPLTSQLDSKLTASGRNRDDVVAIEARKAYLSSIFEDVNLDFIHRVSVYIFDPFNPSDKIEFFYLDPVPFRDKTGIQLFPGIADITDWVDRDYFGVEIRLDFREVTPSLTKMRFEFDLRVMGK
jgi:hypothetical protein